MHKHFGRVLLLFQTILVLISLAHAQSTILDLPRPSQHAVVTQRIGITDITFTDPVTVEGKPLPKGTYGLHMFPGEKEWTVVFSKNSTSWGSFTYDEKEDALRVTVKPEPAEMTEALTCVFDEVKPDSTKVRLMWEKLAIPFKVDVNTNEIVQASLHNQLRGLSQYTWWGYDDAASYLVDNKLNMDDALKYEEASIQNEERFDNLLKKSRILDGMGKKDEE